MKKQHVQITGLFSIVIIVVIAMLMPSEKGRAVSRNERIIEKAGMEWQAAKEKGEAAYADYERLIDESNINYQIFQDSEMEMLCARCRAIKARKENCELGIEFACERSLASQAELYEEWGDEFDYICYETIDDRFPPCIHE